MNLAQETIRELEEVKNGALKRDIAAFRSSNKDADDDACFKAMHKKHGELSRGQFNDLIGEAADREAQIIKEITKRLKSGVPPKNIVKVVPGATTKLVQKAQDSM